MVKQKRASRLVPPSCVANVKRAIPTALGLGIFALGLLGCGEGTTPLGPLENTFLRADDFEITGGSPAAGAVGAYLEFNIRRQRDNQILNRPFNVYVDNVGLAEEQDPPLDNQNRPILLQRSVAFLGNGLDLNGDGQPDLPPKEPPSIESGPLLPYAPPNNWQTRAALAYVPGQTNIPGRGPSDRFGIYFSSILPYTGEIRFRARDELGNAFGRSFRITYPPAGSRASVTVTLANLSASEQEPVFIAICNQLGAAAVVGLRSGSFTELVDLLPAPGLQVDPGLSEPIRYVAEAYQFNRERAVIRVSRNPADPSRLSVPLLGSEGATGRADLTLVDSTGDQLTCFNDLLSDLRDTFSDFF
ncbi:hypothetical protein [Thermostichus vulcanus]|uniref:hypothetical protein n=1 Tax=Thermostichus vulcanus TaxID=32053 RepID=UPI001FCB4D10|nr:hypothetical protein [Thermostichus vulcanus]